MSNQDHEKPGGKSSRKKQKRNKKPDQRQTPMPDQQAAKDLIDAAIASSESSATAPTASAETAPVDTLPVQQAPAVEAVPATETPPVVAEVASVATPPVSAVAPAEPTPVGIQTIASAYRDYTRKSLEDARSYVEKLSGARSIDKAVEVQAEFAKQAYETFVADCWKIRGLYGELFKQSLRLPKSPPGGASR